MAHKPSNVFFPKRLEHGVPCVYFSVCVCVYVCGPVQKPLGDEDRLPWQQLECCCVDGRDVFLFACVCSRAEARQGQ